MRKKENKGHRNPSTKNKQNIGHRILLTTKGHRNPSIRNKENNLKFLFRCLNNNIDLHPQPTLQVLQVFRNFFRFSGSPGFRNLFQVFGNFQVRLIKDIGILALGIRKIKDIGILSLGIRKIKDIGILSLGIRKIKDIGILLFTIKDNGYITEYTETTG